MTTPSPKLGLALPSQVDPFSTADIKANWSKIDAAPGTHICTSSTRPTWTTAQAGRKILETNTGLEWWWTGTAWNRVAATGLLKRSDGSFAIGERTTDFVTSSATYVRVVSVTSVVVPAGNRPIRCEVVWPEVYLSSTTGNIYGRIYRSNIDNSGPVQVEWNFALYSTATNATGGVFISTERTGLAAGTYDFSFQIGVTSGGTGATVQGTTTTPSSISVLEL